MRGKAHTYFTPFMRIGITPACAGKSVAVRSRVAPAWDHPRVCGEKKSNTGGKFRAGGSPPRVRGKVRFGPALPAPTGITPACAGKRLDCSCRCSLFWDHPRVCGEKSIAIGKEKSKQGSPPRVRGKVKQKNLRVKTEGITPACAGKRLKRSHSIGHFSYILCLFHSVLHRASASGGSRAGPCAPPCLPAQNAVPV